MFVLFEKVIVVKHSKYELIFVVFGSFSAVSGAQNIPDAGSLMRQTEQLFRHDQMQRSGQQRATLPPVAVLTNETSIIAQRFKFNGNQRLNTEQLQKVAAPYVNRPLNRLGLQHLTDAVIEAYRQTGWIVQVYVPRQDLTGAELVLQIVESIPPSIPVQ